MTILLSIKPEYARDIFDGVKKYEFRKVEFKRRVKRVIVYVPSHKKIVGYFGMKRIHTGSPQALWDRFKKDTGISRQKFVEYYGKRKSGIAIEIKKPVEFRRHLRLSEIRPKLTVPQSFKYVSNASFTLIKNMARRKIQR